VSGEDEKFVVMVKGAMWMGFRESPPHVTESRFTRRLNESFAPHSGGKRTAFDR
jgi:hypothetical protein